MAGLYLYFDSRRAFGVQVRNQAIRKSGCREAQLWSNVMIGYKKYIFKVGGSKGSC